MSESLPIVNEILYDALGLIGVLATNEPLTADLVGQGRRKLNDMLRTWSCTSQLLWREYEYNLFLDAGVTHYQFGASTDTAKCYYGVQHTVKTTGATSTDDHVHLDNTVLGASAALMKVSIFARATTNVWHHTTFSGVNTGDSYPLTAALPTATATAGDPIVFNWTASGKLSRIRAIRRFEPLTQTETPVARDGMPITKDEYMMITNKTYSGNPQIIAYHPLVSSGIIYVWPVPADSTTVLRFTGRQQIADITSIVGDTDWPREWSECMKYNLAVRWAPAFGISVQQQCPDVAAIATALYQELSTFDRDPGIVKLHPRKN